MKKVLQTKPRISIRKVTLNSLMNTMVDGFGRVEMRLDSIENRLGSVETRLGSVETRLGSVETRLGSVEIDIVQVKENVTYLLHEQKEVTKRLDSLERKQGGLLLSLDETVHRNEFDTLVNKINLIEKLRK